MVQLTPVQLKYPFNIYYLKGNAFDKSRCGLYKDRILFLVALARR